MNSQINLLLVVALIFVLATIVVGRDTFFRGDPDAVAGEVILRSHEDELAQLVRQQCQEAARKTENVQRKIANLKSRIRLEFENRKIARKKANQLWRDFRFPNGTWPLSGKLGPLFERL